MDPSPVPATGGAAADRTADVSVSDLSRDVRPAEDRISEIAGRLGSVRPPSFQELAGARLATVVLGVICGLAVAFLVTWWWTRPSLAEVQALVGSSGSAKEVLEALQALRSAHFGELRDLFQIVVLSGLVPLFTLLAGYAFGSRQRDKGS